MKSLKTPAKKLFAALLMLIGILISSYPSSAENSQEPTAEKTWSQDKRFVDNGDGTITEHKNQLYVDEKRFLPANRPLDYLVGLF